MERTIEQINERIVSGDAIVLTVREVEQLVDRGREAEAREVDVVTTGTMGLMSGTYALLSFPIAPPGAHKRFVKGWLNGVPAHVGPCPNEGLGILDCMVYGTSRSVDRTEHGGGHLFRELVEGKKVHVRAETEHGVMVETDITLEDMPTAKLMSSRNLFRNYRAFVNPSPAEVLSIFHALPFPPRYGGLTFSGCGHLNPLHNDPAMRCIGMGTRLLFNGGEGFVIGCGTRSTGAQPNLMTVADMRGMQPDLMGGFRTAEGPECIVTYALAVPILDDSMLESVLVPDDRIPLPVVDVRDRSRVADTTYAQAWGDEIVTVKSDSCVHCPRCAAQLACPMVAVTLDEDGPKRDPTLCFNCGACVSACPHGCFKCDMGSVDLNIGGRPLAVPVVGRGSNREGALRSMEDLKRRIVDGRFPLTSKVSDIRP